MTGKKDNGILAIVHRKIILFRYFQLFLFIHVFPVKKRFPSAFVSNTACERHRV